MWFITVFEKFEINEYGFPDHGCMRTWGYYSDHETALQALHENWTDMWECCYAYAVLEKIGGGIAPSAEYTQYFKYDRERDGYFEMRAPEHYDHFGNFALG